MAVPKKKTTRARTGKRRGNIKLLVPTLSDCPQCGEKKKSHQACANCGYTHTNKKKKSQTSEKSTKKAA